MNERWERDQQRLLAERQGLEEYSRQLESKVTGMSVLQLLSLYGFLMYLVGLESRPGKLELRMPDPYSSPHMEEILARLREDTRQWRNEVRSANETKASIVGSELTRRLSTQAV